jgi:hypothetical protein
MFALLITAGLTVGLWVLHGATRDYVARRLRFVDAVQKPSAPVLAGVVAALLAAPVVAALPWVGAGTAVGVGLAVGFGVLNGTRSGRSLGP